MSKIAHGLLHGCIGDCCSRRYPSVFTSIDDAEVWNFIYGINESLTQPSKYHSQCFMEEIFQSLTTPAKISFQW